MEANEAIDQKAKAKQLVKQGYHLCLMGAQRDDHTNRILSCSTFL